MGASTKRKSIFSILISRIFLALVIINAIVSIYIIRDEINTETRFKEEKSKELIGEIKGMLGFIGPNIESLEQIYRNKQKLIAVDFEKNLTIENHDNFYIKPIVDNLESDTTFITVYFIEDGKIINSNNAGSVGTNIFSLLNPSDSALFMNKVMKGQPFETKFVYHKKQNRFFATSFYPVLKNHIIIGLKAESPEFDRVVDMFKKRLMEITEANQAILSINFWFHVGNQKIPLINDQYNQVVLEEINELNEFKRSSSIRVKNLGKDLGITYVYEKSQKRIYNFSGFSISIVTDFDKQTKPIWIIVRNRLLLLTFSLLIFFLIVYFATSNLKLTLADLLDKTGSIGEGNMKERANVIGNTEFTTLAERFNYMVNNLEQAQHELISKNNEISAQRDEIEAQRNYAVEQRDIIEKQKTNILDSIKYAKKIQEAVLPDIEYISRILPESFVYFKPCSVVSGDFYWIKEQGDNLIVVASDCTGHGVPGAFMSMLGITLLNEIVLRDKIIQPNLILNELREKIKYALKQTGKDNEAQDGMEMTICSINRKEMKMKFAGAINPLVLIRNKEAKVFEADNMPVGVFIKDNVSFTHHELEIEENDTFYMFSDGFADQIGGPNQRRFMSQNFIKLLLGISNHHMEEQLEELDEIFSNWKKDYKQLDDVFVLGFKVFYKKILSD